MIRSTWKAQPFNDLVDVTQDEIESYYRQHNQLVPITEFRQSNGRWVEGWEVPSLTRDLERASSGIFIADRGPLYKAVLTFERANHIPMPVIAEDGSYTDKEFLYSAYDEYVGMSHRAELEPYAARFLHLAPDEAVESYHQRECEICGETFWPNSSGQKFCSEDCQKKQHSKLTLMYYHQNKAKSTEEQKEEIPA